MFDVLPFPRIMGDTPEKQINEILSYLIQFKETLEFALDNITEENLSPDLVALINGLGANVSGNSTDKEAEFAQLKDTVRNEISRLKFSVNFDTGCLEYTI